MSDKAGNANGNGARQILADHIPVIDFALESANKKHLGSKLVEIFHTVGFVYLKNHGTPAETIQQAFDVSKQFFLLDTDTKRRYCRPSGVEANAGYVPVGMERLNAFLADEKETLEIREAYNYIPFDISKIPGEVPDFRCKLQALYDASVALTREIFECLSLGLELSKADVFTASHQLMGKPNQRGNPTTLRTLWYPPIDTSEDNVAHLTRCGTHSDYGTITLLYQDDIGGLEVENRDDVFQQALPIPGTVLVNVGDLLQRWSADYLRSTRHRVTFPTQPAIKKTRQSMAFFVHPDDDYVIECLDGSGKYPPITAGDYLQGRFKLTY